MVWRQSNLYGVAHQDRASRKGLFPTTVFSCRGTAGVRTRGSRTPLSASFKVHAQPPRRLTAVWISAGERAGNMTVLHPLRPSVDHDGRIAAGSVWLLRAHRARYARGTVAHLKRMGRDHHPAVRLRRMHSGRRIRRRRHTCRPWARPRFLTHAVRLDAHRADEALRQARTTKRRSRIVAAGCHGSPATAARAHAVQPPRAPYARCPLRWAVVQVVASPR